MLMSLKAHPALGELIKVPAKFANTIVCCSITMAKTHAYPSAISVVVMEINGIKMLFLWTGQSIIPFVIMKT